MSTDENERLEELWDEILVADLPEPELMARHAQSPNSLSAEERRIVDAGSRRWNMTKVSGLPHCVRPSTGPEVFLAAAQFKQ